MCIGSYDAQVAWFRYECMGSVELEASEQDSDSRYSRLRSFIEH